MACCLLFNSIFNINYKHWNSAYLHQGTSYQCRDTDPDCIRILICIQIHDSDCHQNLIVCSFAHCQPSRKFHVNLLGRFAQSY